MKIGLIALSFLCLAGVAPADGMEPAGAAAGRAESAAAPVQPQPRARMHKVKRLPRGDLRYCLDLKTQAEIIRCAETGRRK